MTQDLSRNHFARLSSHDLIHAVGFERWGVNAGRANREMRRRAARAGMGVYDWLRREHGIAG